MNARVSLRWKILFMTVMTPLTLGLATLVTVHRNVSSHVNSSSIHESLEHSVSVFESMLRTRSDALGGGAQVIVQDPRFFSLVMLGLSQRDSRFTATVKGMAHDFNAITRTDLFEVVDRRGRIMASVGSAHSSRAARDALVKQALKGRLVQGILVEDSLHFQIAIAPVRADGVVCGALILGAPIGRELALHMQRQMRCEVTFLSGRRLTGTTLSVPGHLSALFRTLEDVDTGPHSDLDRSGVIPVKAPGTTFLTLVRRLPGSEPNSPQLYVMQKAFDTETSFLHVMQRDMLMLALLAVFIALVTGWAFSDQIVRPLVSLVRGAQAMEKGDYDHPLEIRRHDELGYLAERFVEMRRRERAYVSSLEQATRLKSEFISIASHELRTPISVLSGYRDVLASGGIGPVSPKQQEVLEAMRGYLTRLTRVAEDATQVAQITGERLELEMKPFEFEPALRRSVGAALAQGSGRRVHVEVRVEPFRQPVEGDVTALGQAITHLVSNAIRFTADGGRVEVDARLDDGTVIVEVRDTGVGIAPDRLKAILAGDSRGREARESRDGSTVDLEFNHAGLGLGLSIARSIVEAHGGTLGAVSRPSEGSTFTIEFPVEQNPRRRAAA
jgi:signal transduction histidine kinase